MRCEALESCYKVSNDGSYGYSRLDYQPLFGRGAHFSGRDQTRHKRAAEIEPMVTAMKQTNSID